MRCVDCKFHKAFPTTNIHWCEATKKHRRISDEDAYVDAPCKVADRKTEPQKPSDDDETIQAIAHLQKVGWLQEHDRALTEPQTEEWYTFQDKQEYNARHGKE